MVLLVNKFMPEATRLAYGTDEAEEGRNAFLEKRNQTSKNTQNFRS